MVLGLLAVEGVEHAAVGGRVQLAQPDGRRGRERDALVGRAEDDVEVELAGLVRVLDRLGKSRRDGLEEVGAVELARVEKVGRDALGFELEAAELEDAAGEGCAEEVGFVGGEGGHFWFWFWGELGWGVVRA